MERGVMGMFHNRHAELVSASIDRLGADRAKALGARWTLKRVQGDGIDADIGERAA
jgi:hypothetical protein